MAVPRIAYAANRKIGLEALECLVAHDVRPVALLVPKGPSVDLSLVAAMTDLVPEAVVLAGKEFRSGAGVETLQELTLDYLLSVHFPYLVPGNVLDIPRYGALNLHPAYLPYNRGWHTPSWAILEGTPYGATLHWMDEGIDTGDLVARQRVVVEPGDTADTLYARVLRCELELLEASLPQLIAGRLPRVPQPPGGSQHGKSELEAMRQLALHERMTVAEVLDRLRALTTNREDEAAYFEVDGKRYLIQLSIQQETAAPPLKIFRAA